MGQQSLNCKNNAKEQQKQIQTNQTNALLLMRNLQEQSEIKSKKSTTNRSEIQNRSLSSSISNQKSAIIPQHQNILKISNRQFKGAQKIGNRWVQRNGKSLAEIIEGRYNTNMHFPHSQVVTLIESLVYSLAYLEKNNMKHHDFYPTNVFYQNGLFKIANPLSIEASAYSLTQARQRFSFLSPELIAEIVQDTPACDIPSNILYKGDLFAIGMIVLQFCTLQQSAECYDEQNYSLIDKIIQQRLNKVQKLYSQNIADCIDEMIKYEVQQRMEPSQLAIAIFLQARIQKAEAQHQELKNSQGQQAQGPQRKQQQQQQLQYLQVPGQMSPQMPGPPLNQENSVAIPEPNYVYSRIGPNNQSLLSNSTLQNKLKLIEKIQQKPQEQQQSEGQLSNVPSQLTESNQRPTSIQQPPPQRIIMQGPPPQMQGPPPQMQQRFGQPINMSPGQPPMQQVQQRGPPQIMQTQPPQMIPFRAGAPSQGFPMPQNYPPNQPPPPLNYSPVPPPQLVPNSVQPPPPPSIFPTQSKPNSPPIRNNFTESQSNSLLKPQDRGLLSQPTYYQMQGKINSEPIPPVNKQAFTPKILQDDNFQFSFKEKLGSTKQIEFPEPIIKKSPELAPTQKYQPEYYNTIKTDNFTFEHKISKDSPVPSYQSANKYSTADDYSPLLPKREQPFGISKYKNAVDQNGETLEQRVDRILQISRSIK